MRRRISVLVSFAALAACGGGHPSPAPSRPTGPTESIAPTGPTGPTGPTACEGLVPAAPGDGVAYAQQYPTGMNGCTIVTDGRGEWIGVSGLSYNQLSFDFVSAAAPGAAAGHLTVHLPDYGKGGSLVAAQPDGYLVLSRPDHWPGSLQRYDAKGTLLSDDGAHDVWGVYRLPGGGSVLDTEQGFTPNGPAGIAHMIWTGEDGARGVDVVGASPIAVTSGGNVLAVSSGKLRWYDRHGAAMSDPFTDAGLLTTLQNGSGLARRLVALADGSLVFGPGTDTAVRFAGGSSQRSPVPGWLTARAGATIATVRGGRANAFATVKGDATGCEVDVEILTPAGESCGTTRLLAHAPCDGVQLGDEGTVFTAKQARDGETTTCTWRWWSGLLR